MFGRPIPRETSLDPLAAFMDGVATPDRRPVPLKATRIDVTIEAGLAVVTATRVFANAEDAPIEATMTLPMPVEAALFGLTARIGERVLTGRAEPKAAAREAYEDAIDRGKPAVLHEELLPGIHMLSVANIAPGAEVEVAISFALPLAALGDEWRLRIPLTVGDVYGRSPLPASDDLAHAPSEATATLTVACPGRVELQGGSLEDGRATVPLSAPIDLVVRDLPARLLAGELGGAPVRIALAPAPAGEQPLDLAVLVDVSGSMESPVGMVGSTMSKYQAAVLGLLKAAEALRGDDRVALFEFSNSARLVGVSCREGHEAPRPPTLQTLVLELARPHGGTEIGGAIETATATSPARDLLILTDGKSHALDVAALAASGRRFHVVLIGEDSLDAHIGRLAVASGGRLHVPLGDRLAETIAAAIGQVRGMMPDEADEAGGRLVTHRGTTRVEVNWGEAAAGAGSDAAAGITAPVSGVAGPGDQAAAPVSGTAAPINSDDRLPAAVAALAATLRLPHLAPDEAARLSAEAGLTNHLTSLVLVDEAGGASEAIPAQRKVPLAAPRTTVFYQRMHLPSAPMADIGPAASYDMPAVSQRRLRTFDRTIMKSVREEDRSGLDRMAERAARPNLRDIVDEIDFGLAPADLEAGQPTGIPRHLRRILLEATRLPEVRAVADALGIDPMRLVIALLARAAAPRNRTAPRIARAILGDPAPEVVAELAAELGLEPPSRLAGWLRG